MNKIIIVLLIIGAGALVYLFLADEPGVDKSVITDEVDMEQVEEYLQEDTSNSIFGSCNSIPDSSVCIEYRGSIWGDNNMAALNCEGSGTYSTNGCPYGAFGGCQTGKDSVMDMVAWMYYQGGGEITAESAPYAKAACDANQIANWITQDDE